MRGWRGVSFTMWNVKWLKSFDFWSWITKVFYFNYYIRKLITFYDLKQSVFINFYLRPDKIRFPMPTDSIFGQVMSSISTLDRLGIVYYNPIWLRTWDRIVLKSQDDCPDIVILSFLFKRRVYRNTKGEMWNIQDK